MSNAEQSLSVEMTRYVSVVLDIPTRSLDMPFTYVLPGEISDEVQVGVGVLVPFGNRPALGWVIQVAHHLDTSLDYTKIKPVMQVLSGSYFNEQAVALARHIATEYSATMLDALKLFIPLGASSKLVKNADTARYELRLPQVHAVTDTWVSLVDDTYVPPSNASRQRQILEALHEGSMRIADLRLLIPGASTVVKTLERKGIVRTYEQRRMRGTDDASVLSSAHAPTRTLSELTEGQRDALREIEQAHHRALPGTGAQVVAVDGVTGSGKTEVYLHAIEAVLARGKGAIMLVPEISLTPQTVGRVRARFGNQVAVLHSKMSAGERFDQWDLVHSGVARVVVGARSALFAPVQNLGLIVIDEEHEFTYKQSQTPRYHAREVAAHLADMVGCPLVLGSATLSLETYARCMHLVPPMPPQSTWLRVQLSQRANHRPLPPVRIVDLSAEFGVGHRAMISRPLRSALIKTANAGHKAVILLNRRGFAQFVLCRDCGHVPTCAHCSTSYTYHEKIGRLVCHTCGASIPMPGRCPECHSPYLAKLNPGTQQLELELEAQLGEGSLDVLQPMTVVRMDADTTARKHGHEQCLERFDSTDRALLLGTQMIAKGLDFPEVALVGVIIADTSLKAPDFRAAERTYALLEQVSGRAGRGEVAGEVIIQTYWPQHVCIQAVKNHDYQKFCDAELEMRAIASYPPFVRLANVVVWSKSKQAAQTHAQQIKSALETLIRSIASGDYSKDMLQSKADLELVDPAALKLYGPVPCTRGFIKDHYYVHILIKGAVQERLGPLCMAAVRLVKQDKSVSVAIDIDPYEL